MNRKTMLMLLSNEAFNIPELCEKSSWLGGITGDSGDEWEKYGRSSNTVYPKSSGKKSWIPVPGILWAAKLCNMTTSMFTAKLRSGFFQRNEKRSGTEYVPGTRLW